MGKYNPHEHAEELGIRVVEHNLSSSNGLWVPDHGVILLQRGLRRVHRDSTLAHEIAHSVLGHRDSRPKHEVMADRLAAQNMIDPDELHDLMRWSPDPSRWANEMGVSTKLIRVYLNVNRVAS